MNKEYTIGIYIRLSMADEDTGYGSKAESDSISNQRMLINRYLDNHPTLSKCPRLEFADDGYTGTNFRRPQFTAMMEKVKGGEINLICVKDFSRFSRDYIETGNYLECTFPFMGVRFISINDGYDSDDYKGTTGGLEVVMRSIIYAAYSKDLSVKTTTAKIQLMKQGKYVGGYAPYGYILHPTKRNTLAVDPDAAKVVRRIFDEALAGNNTSLIAEMLNDESVPTPGQYFRSKFPDKKKFSRMSEKVSWTAAMVYNLIINPVYKGTLVSRKYKSAGVGSRKRIPSEPIIVDGTHEAIVSSDEFEKAQTVIRSGERNPMRNQTLFPLKGLVRCGNCKRVLSRRKLKDKGYFFSCTHSTMTKTRNAMSMTGIARAGLRAWRFRQSGNMWLWQRNRLFRSVRSADCASPQSASVQTSSSCCKVSLNSSSRQNSGSTRSTRRRLSQKPIISGRRRKQTRSCPKPKKQSGLPMTGCTSLTLSSPVLTKRSTMSAPSTRMTMS